MYKPKSLNSIRTSPDILMKLWEQIEELKEEAPRHEKWEFSEIPNMHQKKDELLKLLDHLEPGQHMFDNRTPVQDELLLFIMMLVLKYFLPYGDKEKMNRMKEHYKQTYQLDDTVGYIHVHREKIGPFEMLVCFAISDGKVVQMTFDDTMDKCLNDLKEKMKGDLWLDRLKFAISLEGSLPDKFVKTSNKDVFNENKELVETIEQFCTTIRRVLNVKD